MLYNSKEELYDSHISIWKVSRLGFISQEDGGLFFVPEVQYSNAQSPFLFETGFVY